MILDKQNLFSEDQAVTTTANSTNVIDLGNDSSKVQSLNEKNVALLIQVTEDFAGGTSIKVTLKSDDDVAFGSATTLLESAVIPLATLKAGYKFPIGRLLPLINEQYLRLTYTVVGTMTAGKIMAGLVIDDQTNN